MAKKRSSKKTAPASTASSSKKPIREYYLKLGNTKFPQDGMPVVERFKGKIKSEKAIQEFFTELGTNYYWGYFTDGSFVSLKGSGKPLKPLFTKKSAKALDEVMDECHAWGKKHNKNIELIAYKLREAQKEEFDQTYEKRGYPQVLVDELTGKQFEVLSDQLSNNESSSNAQMINFLNKEIGVSKDKLSTIVKHFRPKFREDPTYELQRDVPVEKAADGTALENLQDDVHDNPIPTELQDQSLEMADGGALPGDATQTQVFAGKGIKLPNGELETFTLYSIGYKGAEPRASFNFEAKNLEDAISLAKGWGRYHSFVYEDDYIVRPATDADKQFEIHNEYVYEDGGAIEHELNQGTMIPNNQAAVYAAERLPFTGTNLEGKKLLNDDYVVLSFLCYPVWLYSSADGKWYGNKDKFNTITAMHQSESRPDFNAEMIPLHELYKRLFGSIQKFDMGGPVTTLYPMSLDNALEAHG